MASLLCKTAARLSVFFLLLLLDAEHFEQMTARFGG